MKRVVLDTDVLSFFIKEDSRAQIYLPYLQDRQILVSFMTIAELEQWVILSNWSAKRIEWMRLFIARFAVVPYSHDLAVKWAQAMTSARRTGRRIETADAWIAATALMMEIPLLTNNKTDYLGVDGLQFADRC